HYPLTPFRNTNAHWITPSLCRRTDAVRSVSERCVVDFRLMISDAPGMLPSNDQSLVSPVRDAKGLSGPHQLPGLRGVAGGQRTFGYVLVDHGPGRHLRTVAYLLQGVHRGPGPEEDRFAEPAAAVDHRVGGEGREGAHPHVVGHRG